MPTLTMFSKVKGKFRRRSQSTDEYANEAAPLKAGLLSKSTSSTTSLRGGTKSESTSLGIRSKSTSDNSQPDRGKVRGYGSVAPSKGHVAKQKGKTFQTITVPVHVPNKVTTYIKHPVQQNDSWARISLKYGVEVDDIKRANKLYESDTVFTREELLIPVTDDNKNMGQLTMLGDALKEQNEKIKIREEREEREESPEPAELDDGRSTPSSSSKDFLARFDNNFGKTKEAVQGTVIAAPSMDVSNIYQASHGKMIRAQEMNIGSGVKGDTAALSYQRPM
eukprot:m.21449 g.21449  ORF g.21449 m.21449 type:complete len:279 (+) comp7147_c1_seq1:174-1010(+)